MDVNSYLIAVEVPATGPIESLVKALQEGYDNGAAGSFQVIVTRQPTYLVLFARSTVEDDVQYLVAQMAKHECAIQQAAMHQLADEFVDEGGLVAPIVTVLREGDAQIVDFNAALANVEGA